MNTLIYQNNKLRKKIPCVGESVDGHILAVIDAVGHYIDQSKNLDSSDLWVEEARGEPNVVLTCFFQPGKHFQVTLSSSIILD